MNERSRELRQKQTDAEAHLWRHLRARQLGGHKFRRQHRFGHFIVDFVCIERGVIVEVDGGQHEEQREYDRRRSAELEAMGMIVLRYWNDDVLVRTKDVLGDILATLDAPHPNPLPGAGRGDFGAAWDDTAP